MHHEPAIILRHPSAPLPLLHDPREPPRDRFTRTDGMAALTLLVEAHGVATVQSWLGNIAALHGINITQERA